MLSLRSSVAIVAIASSVPVLAADEPVYAPAPAWAVRATLPAAAVRDKTRPLQIFDHQQRIEGARVTMYSDVAMLIADPSMLNNAGSLSLPWVAEQGDLTIHSVSIIRGDAVIDALAGGKKFEVIRREAGLEQLRIDGMRTAMLQVADLRVGDVLRVTTSVTREDRTLGGQAQAFLPVLPFEARPAFSRTQVSWPSDRALAWRVLSTGAKSSETKRDGWTTIDVASPTAKTPDLPDDAPPRFRMPGLFEVSSFADWAAVGRTMAPLYETGGLIADGSLLAKAVDAIAARTRDPRTRAAAALRLAQDEVRYLANGMDGGYYIPQKPAETWSVRYGDCKAKTLLLLAMLARLDIPAEAVLVSATGGDLVGGRLPSPGAFDHVVVRATIDGRATWLDGTGIGTRADDLSDVPAFRHALPIRATGAVLESFAPSAPARAVTDSRVEFDSSAGIGLPMPYRATIVVSGAAAIQLNAAATQLSGEPRDDMIDAIVGEFADASLVEDRKVVHDADAARTTITASGLANTMWQWSDGAYEVWIDGTSRTLEFKPDRTRAAWRTMPVATGAPGTIRKVLSIRLPEPAAGYAMRGAANWSDGFAGARVTRVSTTTDRVVAIDERVERSGVEIAPADIAAARGTAARFAAQPVKLRAPATTPPRWQVAQTGARGDGFKAITGFYDRAIAREPDEARHWGNRASFRAGIYDRKGAIADLDKAIAIEPTAASHAQRAGLLYSEGRMDAAVADAAKAVELEPGETGFVQTLAMLHARAGRHDAALELLDGQVDAAGEDRWNVLMAKAEVLGLADRTDEGLSVADEAVTAANGSAMALNGRCWLKGTRETALDTAMDDCNRAAQTAGTAIAAVLDSRALIHLRQGRLDAAKADLDTALGHAPSMAGALFLRAVVLQRMGDKAGSARDAAAARYISPEIDREYAAYGLKV